MLTAAFCAERKDLLSRYNKTARDYAELVQELSAHSGVFAESREEHLRLRGIAEEARKQTEMARLNYKSHVANHRCL